MDNIITRVAAMLDPAALANFTQHERLILARSFLAVGMAEYPPVTGYHLGERASGEEVCRLCGQVYYAHPLDWRVIGYGDRPFLHVLCDGRRVKL